MSEGIRSIAMLAKQFPDKTGAELIQMHNDDIAAEKAAVQEHLKEKVKFADDINENGGYFQGQFGLDQYYFYNITEVEVFEDGGVWGRVEKIVWFDDVKNEPEFHVKELSHRVSGSEDLSRYGLSLEKRITKEKWDKVVAYINGLSKFVELIETERCQ